ncbi:hypothetical protein [Streptomyces xanthochromogenes]|nr:hypothetical protein [Streptomyces xanthochromogenes]
MEGHPSGGSHPDITERKGLIMSKIIAALRAKKSEPSLKQAAWYFWY